MTAYIAGAISNDPQYKYKFWRAEVELIEKGIVPLSPAWLPTTGLDYAQYMRIGHAMLKECDAIYLLRDWRESNGAVLEHDTAMRLGKTIIFQAEVKSERSTFTRRLP